MKFVLAVLAGILLGACGYDFYCDRAEDAVVDLINALAATKAEGPNDAALRKARPYHRKAQWRVDFVAAENSMGFHAPPGSCPAPGRAIDLARKGQIELLHPKKQ